VKSAICASVVPGRRNGVAKPPPTPKSASPCERWRSASQAMSAVIATISVNASARPISE
jgi:hypothetical protein